MASHPVSPYGKQKPKTAAVVAGHAPSGPLVKQAPSAPLSGVSPPPVAAPQPYDPAYQGTVLAANRNVSLGNNEATWQTQQTGYDLGYDQSGAFNAANPYSEAQRLQDSYHNDQRRTTNSAGNQLYSGSYLNQQAIDDRSYSISDAELKRRAQATYHGIQAGQLQNYSQNAVGVTDAGFNSLLHSTYGG